MRLTHLVLLVSSCSVSVGVAGVSLWQGYAGRTEQVAAVVVALVIAWTVRAVWREAGPAHERKHRVTIGGVSFPASDVALREMPEAERQRITEAA